MSAFTWTDASVRAALGLRAELARKDCSYSGVSTDSRTVREGELYVALVGPRFDGHDFVADALGRGAGGAVVSRPLAEDGSAVLYPVQDTLVALGALAAHRRDALGAPVVGITGSSGKTTVKDLATAALEGTLRVHATPGNLNNRIGMPLTLLAAPDDADAVVLEMGTNEPGEIAKLAAIAKPDVAVVTTVGESHLEKLGSLEGVLEEKLDLLRLRGPGGRCVVGDDPGVLPRAARDVCPEVRVVGWGDGADAAFRPEGVEVDHWGTYSFTWKGQRVRLAIPGRHMVVNALLALAVADLLAVPAKRAAKGLAQVTAGSMRSELRRVGDLTVVVDCYNANPQSVRAALDLMEAQAATRRVAVLGTMLELGERSARLHAEVLADAMGRDLDLLVVTGGFAEVLAGGDVDKVVAAPTWEEAYPELRRMLRGTEVVLLKASRGVALEGLLGRLEADFGAEAAAAAPGEEA